MDFCLCFYSLCCFILFVDVSLCVVRVNLDLCFTERWHLARSRLGTGTSPSVAPPLMLFFESFLDLIPFAFTNNVFCIIIIARRNVICVWLRPSSIASRRLPSCCWTVSAPRRLPICVIYTHSSRPRCDTTNSAVMLWINCSGNWPSK